MTGPDNTGQVDLQAWMGQMKFQIPILLHYAGLFLNTYLVPMHTFLDVILQATLKHWQPASRKVSMVFVYADVFFYLISYNGKKSDIET